MLLNYLLNSISPIVVLFAIISLLSIPYTRRIIFRSILFIIGLAPAAVLFVLAVLALPFWRIALWLADKVLRVLPIDRFAERILAIAGSRGSSALTKGDRKAFSLERWPAARFPYLYMDNIPDDIRRPLYEDGRLVGGMISLAWQTVISVRMRSERL
jgi:hypothetical protein